MGFDDDAVVTPDLRLRGLASIRIVDASVIPALPRGHELADRDGGRAGRPAHAVGVTGYRPVLCCPDKFRGSLTALEAAQALGEGVEHAGRTARQLPLADGGEGTLDVLCPEEGDSRAAARVTGPLGDPVEAEWGMRGDTAVIEMARASGWRS